MTDRENVVIKIWEPGLRKVIQAGKFVLAFCPHLGAQWVYAYDIPLVDRMGVLDAWGVAPAILRAMRERDIHVIHYYNAEEDVTYVTTDRVVRQRGILQAHKGRGVCYYHLQFADWQKVRGRPCRYPRTNQALSLAWAEEERKVPLPEIRQMALPM
jgi:hypothetical protein